ncbi:MAG: hypothetical protein H3C64_13235, partial [Candidatus Kuenenia stuttgartiensis]|nr:hypothetical protein [Candidatus Kuenenia stuttgartiensis]
MKKNDYVSIQESHPALFDNSDALIKIIKDNKEISEWQEEKNASLQKQGKSRSWADIGLVFDDPSILILRDLVE